MQLAVRCKIRSTNKRGIIFIMSQPKIEEQSTLKASFMRGVMWNQVEVGDPYDIRKSMIMKVSSEKREFMGKNLPLVCLLQAAEIERLMDCLDDYRVKYKEIEKVRLDRHSYQVQIKELHAKSLEHENLKKELARMREFSQRQQNEQNQSRKQAQDNYNKLKSNYVKALQQINADRAANSSLSSENKLLKSRIEAESKSKARELEELRLSLQSSQRSEFEKEKKNLIAMIEQQRSEFSQEARRMREALSQKDSDLDEHKRALDEHMRKAKDSAQMTRQLETNEQKTRDLIRELEKVNKDVRDRTSDVRNLTQLLEQANGRIRAFEGEINKARNIIGTLERQKSEVEVKYSDLIGVKKLTQQFEQKLEKSESERLRLEKTIKIRSQEIEEREHRLGQMELHIANLTQKMKIAEARSNEAQLLSEQVRQSESRVSKMSQQILGFERERSEHELLIKDHELLRTRFSELDRRSSSNELAAEDLSRTNAQLSVTLDTRNKEVEELKNKLTENENLVRQFKKIADGLRQTELQNRDLHSELKIREEKLRLSGVNTSKIAQEKEEHQLRLQQKEKQALQLSRKLQSLQQDQQLKEEYFRKAQQEMRLSSGTQRQLQIQLQERADQITLCQKKLTAMNSENSSLRTQVSAAQDGLRNSTAQISRLATEIQRIQEENETLKPKAAELVQANRKLILLRDQTEAMEQDITQLKKAIENKNNQIRGLGGHVDAAQEQVRSSVAQFTRLTTELNEYKSKLTENNKESETYKQRIQKLLAENSETGQQLYTAQENIRLSASKIDKINNQLKIVCNQREQLQGRLTEGIKKWRETEGALQKAAAEITRLNGVIEKKNIQIKGLRDQMGETEGHKDQIILQQQKLIGEVNEYRTKLTESTSQSQTYKQRISKITNENKMKTEQLQQAQEGLRLSSSKIQQINNELKIVCNQKEQLSESLAVALKKNKEYENKITQASAQIERINEVVGKKNNEIKTLVMRLNEAQNELNDISTQQNKTVREVNEFKSRLTESSQQSQTYKQRIQKLLAENSATDGELKMAQENIRLSASKIDKINNELKIVCNQKEQLLQKVQQLSEIAKKGAESEKKLNILSQEIERLNGVLEKKYTEIAALAKRLSETDEMSQTITLLQEKVTQLVTLNRNLEGEKVSVEEKAKTTSSQTQKYVAQVKECREKLMQNEMLNSQLSTKVQKMVSENTFLNTQFRTVQDHLRVSTATQAKLSIELTNYKDQMAAIERDNANLQQRLKKITEAHNVAIEDVQKAQESARLSGLQLNRTGVQLNEFKAQRDREVSSLQQKLQQSALQINHLSEERQKAEEESRLSNNALAKQRNELRELADQHQLVKKRISELGDANRKLSEAENRVAMLAQEVDRLTVLIQKRDLELNNLRAQTTGAEENLRQSSLQQNRINTQLTVCKERLTESNAESETYRARLQKLQKEYTDAQDQVHSAQEKVRLSSSQFQKLNNEFKIICNQNEELKKKLQESQENRRKSSIFESQVVSLTKELQRINGVMERKNIQLNSLRGQTSQARQALRWSSVQQSKLGEEITMIQSKLSQNTQESETYRQRIQKLLSENNTVNESLTMAQDNIRLSANKLSKLNNELKIACNQNEQLKQKLDECVNFQKKALTETQTRIMKLSQEIERLNRVVEQRYMQNLTVGKKLQQSTLAYRTWEEKSAKIIQENKSLQESLNTANEQIRNVASKVSQDIKNYQEKISHNEEENSVLRTKILKTQQEYNYFSNELKGTQDQLRLSANTQSKLNLQLADMRARLQSNERESDNFRAIVNKLKAQNNHLTEQYSKATEGLRLSNNQIQKLSIELNETKSGTASQVQSYRLRLQKLQEKTNAHNDEIAETQQKLRLSSASLIKISNEAKTLSLQNDDLRRKIQEMGDIAKKANAVEGRAADMEEEIARLKNMVAQKSAEIKSLGGVVSEAEESLRQSSLQQNRLSNEVNDYKMRLTESTKDSQTYQQRIQKIIAEQQASNFELQAAQEGLRLSNSNIGKLNNELKVVCNQNEELKQRLKESQDINKKIGAYEENLTKLMSEIERQNGVIERKNVQIRSLGGQVQESQEALRLSTTAQKALNRQLSQIRERFNQSTQQSQSFKQRLLKLQTQHSTVSQRAQAMEGQLRLSATNTTSQLREASEKIASHEQENALLKSKMDKIISQNSALFNQSSTVQERIRLSSATIAKLTAEVNEYQSRIATNNADTQQQKQRIQKLTIQRDTLRDEFGKAQQTMRLSSAQLIKLKNELRILHEENEELKRKMVEVGGAVKKVGQYEGEINRLRLELDKANQLHERRSVEVRTLQEQVEQSQTLTKQVYTVQTQLKRLSAEKDSLLTDLQTGQEQVRLSGLQGNKLRVELDNANSLLAQLQRENEINARKAANSKEIEEQLIRIREQLNKRTLQNKVLTRRLGEIDEANKSIGTLQEKINRLSNQNFSYEQEIRNAQEQVRLSTSNQTQLQKQINEYKMQMDHNLKDNEQLKQKIARLSGENQNLCQEVRTVQESLRLSAGHQAKIAQELRNAQLRVEESNLETETYRRHIEKISSENRSLVDEVRDGQERIRLSAGQMSKMSNELKITCNEIEQLRSRLQEALKYKAKAQELEEHVYQLTNEVQKVKKASGAVENESLSSKEKVQEYKIKMSALTEQFEKMNKMLEGLRSENKSLKESNNEMERRIKANQNTEEKVQYLVAEIKRLEVENEQKERDLAELRIRFSDEAAMIKRIQEHLALFVILFAEIESLRRRVREKEREVAEVRQTSLRLAELNQV